MIRSEGAAPGADEQAILRLIHRWIVYRDSSNWERLRAIWHDNGTMTAGWQKGTADEFVAASRLRSGDGRIRAMHQLGAVEIEVWGNRAISQNKVIIQVRVELDGVLCDITCMGRHLDRWEKRAGLWGLLARETIYDRDRIDAIVPGQVPVLDSRLLQQYGEGFRHLAYAFVRLGFNIDTRFPAINTAEGDRLVLDWRDWLREK